MRRAGARRHRVDPRASRRPIARAGGADAERLLELVHTTVEALETATGRVATPSAPGPDRDTEAMTRWRHERTPATAIAQLLGPARGEAARVRAVEAIERNAKLLIETVLHPPA